MTIVVGAQVRIIAHAAPAYPATLRGRLGVAVSVTRSKFGIYRWLVDYSAFGRERVREEHLERVESVTPVEISEQEARELVADLIRPYAHLPWETVKQMQPGSACVLNLGTIAEVYEPGVPYPPAFTFAVRPIYERLRRGIEQQTLWPVEPMPEGEHLDMGPSGMGSAAVSSDL